jgi:hypothetical protein
MKKFSLLLLSEPFLGFTSYSERSISDPQIGGYSPKGPPGIKTVDLACWNAADRTIANDGTCDYN